MSVLDQPCNIGNRVTSRGTCTKPRATNINSIGTVIHGFNTNIGIFGGG